ncbi:SDR family NAD(P)-dependent oxidoreductase [Methylobacterium sp. J-070]|uniref:SDR family NAD(P)-dependent oxidoreductase n=1 Tax=Methylobacterium sp. J-070 TaxID=2836650 RepID=UPI001FB9249B|nr:SDR family oxidoreductase [Methylobacterium sp. J-070]MCJ2048410.1 SDR family oxidoreductase [Methylobacterium sp. J-070]
MQDSQAKVAIVTGASRGLGAAIVTAFRGRDYRVVATSRSIGPSDDPDLRTVAGDIGDPATSEAVVGEAIARFGWVDTLVNNAGIFIPGPFARYTPEQHRQMVSTNLDGFFHMTQRAVSVMEARGGHIVQVTTTLAERSDARRPSVLAALTKGGLNAATRSLAIEYAKQGIRVNAVSPGLIKTPMQPVEKHEMMAGFHPMGRMGEIEDIVRGVLYLEDAGFVTGEILHVDGGQSAGC